MKRIIGYALVLLFFGASSFAEPGDWSGSGGAGFAYVFTNLGYRIHRDLLMEPYDSSAMQVRDEMNLAYFLKAVGEVKVIVTEDKLLDKHNHEQTAKYLNLDELRTYYREKGRSAREIDAIIGDFPMGLIVVQNRRFLNELHANVAIAMMTVFHEYRRALGFDEDNYRSSASKYGLEFFERLRQVASPISQQIYTEAQTVQSLSQNKMQLIDSEKQRLEREIEEDSANLKKIVESRRPYVDAARKSYSAMVNAYADILDTMGVAVMPSPSANSDTVRALGLAGSASMDTEQKLSELDVINLQANFLEGNIKRNMDFYEKIDFLRQQLFLDQINSLK
ncbi:MAG: hypothetical protein KDD50_03045 [Bdellovibrionales bacterium]|nr:hypothetical protein [Bdellovibrionales bacterium]